MWSLRKQKARIVGFLIHAGLQNINCDRLLKTIFKVTFSYFYMLHNDKQILLLGHTILTGVNVSM